jgi:hypothetical protein
VRYGIDEGPELGRQVELEPLKVPADQEQGDDHQGKGGCLKNLRWYAGKGGLQDAAQGF